MSGQAKTIMWFRNHPLVADGNPEAPAINFGVWGVGAALTAHFIVHKRWEVAAIAGAATIGVLLYMSKDL